MLGHSIILSSALAAVHRPYDADARFLIKPLWLQGETFDAPAPCEAEAPLEALAECVQRLLNVFVDNGFASKVCSSTAFHLYESVVHLRPFCTALCVSHLDCSA